MDATSDEQQGPSKKDAKGGRIAHRGQGGQKDSHWFDVE
jgi:hypothetical protein